MFLSRSPERVETERHLRDVARLEEVRRLEDLLVADAVSLHRFLNGRSNILLQLLTPDNLGPDSMKSRKIVLNFYRVAQNHSK